MTLAPGTFARVGAVVVVAVLLQISVVAQIGVLGASADLVPLVVAGVGLYAGSIAGSATGFGAGLLLDLALGANLGASALVLTAVGYGAGRLREARDPAHGLVGIPVAAAATAVYLIGVGALGFMLEEGTEASPLVFRGMLVTVALNALIALPVLALVLRAIRGALLADPLDRRARRARTSSAGPIGLRGLEL